MKKFTIIGLLLILSCSLFATGFVAPYVGYSISSVQRQEEGFSKIEKKEQDIVFGARGAHYFGNNMGLGYGLALAKPVKCSAAGIDVKLDNYYDYFINGLLTFSYRMELSDMFALNLGAGFALSGTSLEQTASLIKTKQTYTEVDLAGDVSANINLGSFVGIVAGCQLNIPVYGKYEVEKTGTPTVSLKVTNSGFIITPYIGAAFSY